MKIINFYSTDELLELPVPASESIPEWYKNMPKFSDGGTKPKIKPDGEKNVNMKSCVPYLDVMLTGYVATLWQDVQVDKTNQGVGFKWRSVPDPIAARNPEHSSHGPIPEGHSPQPYIWKIPFLHRAPKGYSLLITHPINRFDLPFTTISGLVDSDLMLHNGKVPFFLKEGFEGIIPKGTPIYQIIPIKREPWLAIEDPSLLRDGIRSAAKSSQTIFNWYKNNIWQKKIYKTDIKKI